MNDDERKNVNPSSTKFCEAVAAGLNSSEDTRNWHASNKLDQELKEDSENRLSEELPRDPSIPLFMRDIGGDYKGNDQDEKDETAE